MKPFPYEEILNLGPPQSGKHPKMAVADRAAQFAPFSALTGHGAALAETARLTERRCGRDDDIAVEIDRTLESLRRPAAGRHRRLFCARRTQRGRAHGYRIGAFETHR